jgi:hypothetical protein
MLRVLANRERFMVVPLKDFRSASAERVVVGLRHDVDLRLANALDMARLERLHGLPATYFVLHTAPYYGSVKRGEAKHDPDLIHNLRLLQDLGHEVGWHNDLVTLQYVYNIEPRTYLTQELAWLRGHGINVRGSASHGSYWCHSLGFHNNYFFADLEEAAPSRPNADTIEAPGRPKVIKGTLAEFDFEYEAYHLDNTHYFSDARFDTRGRRWHPDALDLDELQPGDKAIILTHPDHWARSVLRKTADTFEHGVRRLLTRRPA